MSTTLPAPVPALAPSPFPREWNLADLQSHFGVPAERIRLVPPPGYATEEDLLYLAEHEDCLCELVDGTLLEKPVGINEGRVAARIIMEFGRYADLEKLGEVFAPDAPMRILPKKVRMPDVSFISHQRLEPLDLETQRVAPVAPEIAIEVLSKSNTRREMELKLKQYFEAGVRHVWFIDPAKRTAKSFSSPTEFRDVPPTGFLAAEDVLPGFRLSLAKLFTQAKRKRKS
jgi:Uma2 family endonuclease